MQLRCGEVERLKVPPLANDRLHILPDGKM